MNDTLPTGELKPSAPASILTREEAAAIAQSKALTEVVGAAAPVIENFMKEQRAIQQEKQQHELRLTELEGRLDDAHDRKIFPLFWFAAVAGAALLGWAAYTDHWPIVTYAITAIGSFAAGRWGRAERAESPDE